MISLEKTDLPSSREDWQMVWQSLEVPYPFLHWEWQMVWWEVFGKQQGELCLYKARQDEQTVGMVPLIDQGREIQWSGGREISDYLDIVSKEQYKEDIWQAILPQLSLKKERSIVLSNIPQQSASINALLKIASVHGYNVTQEKEDVVPYLTLPKTFDEYLTSLGRKDRHEMRRKMRRFEEATKGKWEVKKTNKQTLEDGLATFFQLFRMRHPDKQQFMTETMEVFFRKECQSMESVGLLDMSSLCVGDACIAMTIGFVSGGRYYLYNSAFDPHSDLASGGLILKILLIKESIEKGLGIFDFMQGHEPYKYDLGAKDAFVSTVTLKPI